ncbi:MAG: hypothetical protein AUJ98_02605 [Bacteroidetes bacterium CG2_30_33_31]|nr:MAG: hypothetical protein AUJ98_02605 [Bacteroidetes bacterium CG2_30_33_31]
MKQINFIIASKSYLINKGLSITLNEIKNAKVVEIIEDSSAIIQSLTTHQPDFLIVASDLIRSLSDEVLNSIFKSSTNTKIIQLKFSPEVLSNIIIHSNFDVYSTKKETIEYFLNLVETDNFLTNAHEEKISNRERTILKHVALGKTNKEIAEALFISIHTVITHRKKITAKLGIKSISGLTVYAIINGLISMEEVE